MFKRIAAQEKKGIFKYNHLYYTNGTLTVDDMFEPVEKMVGEIFEEKEMTRESISKMIDQYTWAIDDYCQQMRAERKNRNIKVFLGEEA